MKTSGPLIITCAFIACVVGGIGCFRNGSTPYIPNTEKINPVLIPANIEGGKASTGGIQATITPVLETQSLVDALPGEDSLEGYTATVPKETSYPVPLQDGTRTEYTNVSKSFTRSADGDVVVIQTALSDTRSIPALTAFLQSYSAFDQTLIERKRITVQDETAWLTYRKNSSDAIEGYGSMVMLYRNRFLITIDGNLGVTQDELIRFLDAFHFDKLK
jgi:hypothetical protein